MNTTCMRKLEFDAAHRLVNHESLCAHLHGHRYTAEIECEAPLDPMGRVVDFGVIKGKIGGFVADRWDHAALLNAQDKALLDFCRAQGWRVYEMPGNPTAELIAAELLRIASELLNDGDGLRVLRVRIWETPNCWAEIRT